MKIILFALIIIGIVGYKSKAQNTLGGINSGASSNNNNPYSVGDIFVVGVDQKSTASGTIGTYSTILKNTNGIIKIEKSDFTIYPNPARSEIVIQIDSTLKDQSIVIYNINGRIEMQQLVLSNSIDISSLSSGVYILNINSKSIRLIKE